MNSLFVQPQRLATILGVLVLGFAARTSSADARRDPVAGAAPVVPTKNDLVPAPSCIPRSHCCRICATGTACGNWCSKEIFNCSKARGCACDVSKVCK